MEAGDEGVGRWGGYSVVVSSDKVLSESSHLATYSQGVHLAQGIHALLTCQVAEVQCN